MPLFDTEFLKKLEYLALVSRRVFRGQLLAQQRTRQLGAGLEFAEHREYTAGDDFRHVDWNVFARLDELLIKRFQEEEDLHVYILLDCSRSMARLASVRSAGRERRATSAAALSKFDYARQVAAALAYIALDDLDRVAIAAFAGDIQADFPLMRGKGRVLTLLRFLEDLQPVGAVTNLARAVEQFVSRGQRNGVVLVISDFFDPAGYQRAIDLLRYRRYEPHLIQIYAPQDAAPDLLGDVQLVDVESDATRRVTVTEKSLARYREIYEEFLAGLLRYSRSYGLGCTRSPTTVPFDELILKMMRAAGVVR